MSITDPIDDAIDAVDQEMEDMLEWYDDSPMFPTHADEAIAAARQVGMNIMNFFDYWGTTAGLKILDTAQQETLPRFSTY